MTKTEASCCPGKVYFTSHQVNIFLEVVSFHFGTPTTYCHSWHLVANISKYKLNEQIGNDMNNGTTRDLRPTNVRNFSPPSVMWRWDSLGEVTSSFWAFTHMKWGEDSSCLSSGLLENLTHNTLLHPARQPQWWDDSDHNGERQPHWDPVSSLPPLLEQVHFHIAPSKQRTVISFLLEKRTDERKSCPCVKVTSVIKPTQRASSLSLLLS